MKTTIMRWYRRLFWRRSLCRYLRSAVTDTLTAEELAQAFFAASPRAIERLVGRATAMADRLKSAGALTEERHRGLTAALSEVDPLALSQRLSPYHPPLAEKEFYRLSDAPTRRRLRRDFARFAKRHHLSPASAALLWQGERRSAPSLALICLPVGALLPAIALLWAGLLWLPTSVLWLMLLTIPAVIAGGLLCASAILQKILPDTPLPLLEEDGGHSILTVWVTKLSSAEAALEETRSHAVQTGEDCLLLLTLPDGGAAIDSGEEAQIAQLTQRAVELSREAGAAIAITVLPRRYTPKKRSRRQWIGSPTLSQVAMAVERHLQTLSDAPEAILLLPSGGVLLPGGREEAAAALFHPLCPSDALVFLRTSRSPLPADRLSVLRQCLLQKFDAPADLAGWGIYRRSAIRALAEERSLSPRLMAQPLYADRKRQPILCPCTIRPTPSALPVLRLLLPLMRMLLLFGAVAARLSPMHLLLLWGAASADLLASALLSLRLGRQLSLYTIPAVKRLTAALLSRTILPAKELLAHSRPRDLRMLCLLSLAFGGAVVAFGTPLSVLGLLWIVAPLLLPESAARGELPPSLRGACYALAAELHPYLHSSRDRSPLPPAYLTDTGEHAPYTTPAVLGSCLAADIFACDLGLIDPFTLERRTDRLLSRLEALPTRCGLPYARYDRQTGEFYKDSRVDTAAVGLYALCLAAAEAGLHQLSARNPALHALSDRTAHLSAQMDLTLLLDDEMTLCRTLTPEGKQEGKLTCLAGEGGLAAFALLCSDSAQGLSAKQKLALWERLLCPAKLLKGRCLLLSEHGSLADYLLPLRLLPVPGDGLLTDAARRAVRAALREGRKLGRRSSADQPPSPARAMALSSLLNWPHLFSSPRSIAAGSEELSATGDRPQPEMTAPLLCLLLRDHPRFALSHLRRLQRIAPAGGFADPAHPERIPVDGLALSLIALAGAIHRRGFAERLADLPRCRALLPLLARRPDSAQNRTLPLPSAETTADTPASPSVLLLGDAANGLLIAGGQGICLYRDGIPLTAPVSPAAPLIEGRGSGILLMREGKLIALPCAVQKREAGRLTLSDGGITCEIARTLHGWSMTLEQTDSAVCRFRFLFCPALSAARLEEKQVEIDGQTLLCLWVEYAPTLTLLIAVTGAESAFTHADPSPFPRGRAGLPTIFAIPPHTAEGTIPTPSCLIGGDWSGKRLTLRFVFAADRDDALAKLRAPAAVSTHERLALPLPAPDGSLASRVLEWQIGKLCFDHLIPAAMAVGTAGSELDQLSRCLAGGAELLRQRGFSLSEQPPIPLSVSRREGAEALIARLLAAAPEDVETPLLPADRQITYPDGFPRIRQGRNARTPSRTYWNGVARLTVTPDGLELMPCKGIPPIELTLRLCRDGHTLLLPAGAAVVTYAPAAALLEGDGYSVSAALCPRLPLLAVILIGAGERSLCAHHLPPPYREETDECLYSVAGDRLLYLRRIVGDDRTLWLIGTFPRSRDRLYYLVRSAVTLPSLPHMLTDSDRRHRAATAILQIEGAALPSLPSIASVILASDLPARGLLTPLCLPEVATADLIRLAMAPPTLLFPLTLVLHAAVTDEGIADLRIPSVGGRVSLYLLAARCLEQVMEEEPHHPLLPPIVAAFARLAKRLGDQTGKALYDTFSPTETPAATSPHSLCGIAPETVALLADLSAGKAGAVSALLEALRALPVDPHPLDAALLWSGLFWGVLGFTPSSLGDGFTLAPMAVEEEITLLLSYRGEWRICLSPHEPPRCTRRDDPVGDGESAEKIFRRRKISLQNGCIVHKNSVK